MESEMFLEPIYGNLPYSWSLTTIGQLVSRGDANIQTGPFGTMLHAESYIMSGKPVVAVKHLGDNRLLHEGLPRIGPEDSERLERYTLREGDIVFGRKGAVERRAYVTSSEDGWLQGSDCIRVRFKSENINPKYVSYVLGSYAYRKWIERNAHGATMPSLNQEIISRIPLPIPPLPEQHAIARILGSLDDKIELNRRMNETMESMACALFKSWFVDFDPVRAKAEGRKPVGMDAEMAALFPSRLEESNIGEIPYGWKVQPIGEIARVLGGGTPSTKELAYWEGGTHPFCAPKDMSSLEIPVLLGTERYLTDLGVNRISSGQLPAGTVLLSSRAPIGYLAIAEIPISINQGIIAIICNHKISNLYVLRWLQANMDKIIANANGSTFPEISKYNFKQIKILIPTSDILEQFRLIIEPLYHQLISNARQSRALVSIRDALLPRLLSRKVSVLRRDV